QQILAGDVLEEIAREHHVDAGIAEPAEVVGDPAVHLHVGVGEAAHLLVGVDRPLLAAPDVIDELAEAGADIEHRIGLPHVALEELGAEHLPDGGLGAPFGGIKALLVQPAPGHAPASWSAPADTSAGNAAATSSSGSSTDLRCDRARWSALR